MFFEESDNFGAKKNGTLTFLFLDIFIQTRDQKLSKYYA